MFGETFEFSYSYSILLNRIRVLTFIASWLPLTLCCPVKVLEERLDRLKNHENATEEIDRMNQELSKLIERFSRTLLTVEANHELSDRYDFANSNSKKALIEA